MKKKLLIVLFAFVMVFSLVGCGNDNEALNDGTDNNVAQDERDNVNDSRDTVREDMDNIGEDLRDGVEDTGDAIKDGVDEMTGMDRDKTNE